MLAQEEARRLGHNFVGTEQILLGLIGEGKGIAFLSLKANGVSLRDARVEVEKIIGRGNGFVAVEIPFTPRAKRVLELSWREATMLKDNYISTQHLLLGLLREGGGVACDVLEKLNIDQVQLRGQVLKSMGKAEGGDIPGVPVIPKDVSEIKSSYSWYDQDCINALTRAWGIAETFGAETIAAEHLGLVLLRENAFIKHLQNDSGVNLAELRQQLLSKLPCGSTVPSESKQFSSEAAAILSNAWKIAVAEKLIWVSIEALILGALDGDDAVLSQALRAVQAEPSKIATSIRDSIKASKRDESLDTGPVDSPFPASPPSAARWSAGGWFIALVASALLIYAIYLTDYEKFVRLAPVLLLICFVIMAVLLFRRAIIR